jgi:putative peptidoglycan lipid II flippase
MIRRFFNSQTKTVTFAAGLLSVSALASRFLGLIRDGLLAGYFGASIETDIYFVAFRIPDFIYNFLIVGGLSIAFLPLFSEYYSRNKKEAWDITNNLLNVFSLLIIVSSIILFIFTPWLIRLIAPGFSIAEKELASALTRLMLLSPIFFGISNIFSSILQYFNRFLVYSVAPILYNVGIILGIIFLSPRFGIFGVGIGVVFGAFLHLIIQVPSAVSCGFKYKFIFKTKHPSLKEVVRLMIPRSFAVGVQQINLIIITAIASTLFAGSIAIFNFSNNLQYVPVGIFGISFAVASFPKLSKAWARGKKEEFLSDFSSVFRQIIFLIIPASILIFLLRTQLVRVVLGSLGPGRFSWQDTVLTSASLGIFSFGIFASALIPFVCRAFFSFKDTKTPTLIAAAGVSLNIFLSFYLTWILGNSGLLSNFMINNFNLYGVENISVIGLPLAFSISVVFQFSLLIIFFYKKIGDFRIKEITSSLWKILISSSLMFLSIYFILFLTGKTVDTKTFLGIFTQGLLAGLAGIIVYLLISIKLRMSELKIIKLAILNQFSRK